VTRLRGLLLDGPLLRFGHPDVDRLDVGSLWHDDNVAVLGSFVNSRISTGSKFWTMGRLGWYPRGVSDHLSEIIGDAEFLDQVTEVSIYEAISPQKLRVLTYRLLSGDPPEDVAESLGIEMSLVEQFRRSDHYRTEAELFVDRTAARIINMDRTFRENGPKSFSIIDNLQVHARDDRVKLNAAVALLEFGGWTRRKEHVIHDARETDYKAHIDRVWEERRKLMNRSIEIEAVPEPAVDELIERY
jgi:hypothetical protein